MMAYNKQTLKKIQQNAAIYAMFNNDLTITFRNSSHGMVL